MKARQWAAAALAVCMAAALSLPLCPVAKLPRPPHAAALLADRYSPVYVQLSPRCVLPD